MNDGTLTMRMACGLAGAGECAMDQYLHMLLHMLYARRTALEAVREAER